MPKPLPARIHSHLRDTFAWRESELGIWQGVQFVLGITVPALVGWLLGQPSLGFIGALAGMMFALGDTQAPLAQRLLKLAQTTGAILLLGTLGAFVGANSVAFWAILLVALLVTGWLALSGQPLAASTRLGAIALVSTVALPSPGISLVAMVLFSALISAATRIFGHLRFPNSKSVVPPAEAFKSLSAARSAHFCLCYALAGVAALLIGQWRGVSHPTWIATTVLLVMQPDARASVARIVQRAFGTLCGVGAAALTVALFHSTPALLIAIALLSYLTPHATTRNYWSQSALIAWLILTLYDFASGAQFTSKLLGERLSDVIIGCLLAFFATLAAFLPGRKRPNDRSPLPLAGEG